MESLIQDENAYMAQTKEEKKKELEEKITTEEH